MDEYRRKAAAVPMPGGMVPLVVYGELESLEGSPVDGAVVVEFPSREAALAWYHSEEYQSAIPLRQQAGDYDVFIVDGME